MYIYFVHPDSSGHDRLSFVAGKTHHRIVLLSTLHLKRFKGAQT
jgi:hypothetical protein